MTKPWRALIALALATFLIVTGPSLARSQGNATLSSPTAGAPVVLDNKPLFTIRESFGSTSPELRAQETANKVETFAKDASIPLDSLQVGEQNGITVLFSGETVIARITEADAKAANTTPRELANQYIKTLKDSISQYRKKYSLSGGAVEGGIWEWLKEAVQNVSTLTVEGNRLNYSRAILYTLIATVTLIILLLVLKNTFAKIHSSLNSRRNTDIPPVRIRGIQLLHSHQVTDILLGLTKAVRWISTLGILCVYLVLVLSFFPWTRKTGITLINDFLAALNLAGSSFLAYIPKLFIIAITLFITYSIIRFLDPLFTELGKGTISFPGFYPEWAKPTYNILILFIIALAGVICFPYLPGFGSPSFQGISIFLGVLVSLGSSAAVSNVVSGIILVYTRAFQIGDLIEIAGSRADLNVKGNVEEKSLLVTRIRTGRNILVTIPNAAVLSSTIRNYSASIRDTNIPVIVSTRVNFRYDVPWQKVYEILLDAASITSDVLADPAPKVSQESLGEFSVSYKLSVRTNHPNEEATICSELHHNIRAKCDAAGIEILSPHYSAVRDGNMSTVPEDYLPKDYTPRGFQLNSLGNLFQIDMKWGSGENNGKQSPTTNTPPEEQHSQQRQNPN